MRYHIWTIGCQMNTADSQRLGSALERMGYGWTDQAEDADVIVLNTCVVRQQAEDKVYGRLGALRPIREARPDTVVGLMGCLVGHKPKLAELSKRFPMVDVFIPPSETKPLTDILETRALESEAEAFESAQLAERWRQQDAPATVDWSDRASNSELLLLPQHEQGSLVNAHVPVVYGCNWVCTFCIIPSRRGPERSRPIAEIRTQVEGLVEQGVRQVTLLGQIVDRYGYDWGEAEALPALLRELNGVDGLERIRFLTSHPSFMSDELLDTVAELPKVMEQIEVPVQAGDDEVLTRMKRGYSVDEYRRLVARIRRRIPDVAIHTDIIVGFCGETDAQFQGTYDLLEELRLDKAHLAKYSARPGTVASKRFLDDVPELEKERRRKALDELQSRICAEKNAELVGQSLEVLVEGRDRGRWRARTRRGKLVFFDDPRPLLGRRLDLEIQWTGPWSMIGQALDRPTENRIESIPLTAV